jgi:hypothetical protein
MLETPKINYKLTNLFKKELYMKITNLQIINNISLLLNFNISLFDP